MERLFIKTIVSCNISYLIKWALEKNFPCQKHPEGKQSKASVEQNHFPGSKDEAETYKHDKPPCNSCHYIVKRLGTINER